MSIADNLSRVRERIARAAIRAGRRPDSVKLVGVTKAVDLQRIQMAVAAGLRIIGENYIQEAREKIPHLKEEVEWHFIGRLQTNKAKYAVRLFDLVQTVDSMKLALELDRRAQALDMIMPILMQVNVASEKMKGGVALEKALHFAAELSHLQHLRLRGLMTMPPFFSQPERARPYFRRLRQLAEEIAAQDLPAVEMEEISMGMSGDFEVAVEEGASLVRVGSAIFGSRP